MDPAAIVASRDVLEKIEAVCRRHFSSENDRHECYIFVLDSLKADDFKRLRAFKGRSKLSTYLYSLINSLVIDFRRKRYGRRRIPVAVLQLGKWAEAVYRLVCWQKFSFDDAYDFLQVDGLYEGNYDQFLQEIEPIRDAPCRENPTFQSMDEIGRDSMQNMDLSGANPLEALIQKLERERRILALRVIRATTEELPESDQILVRLVFGSGQSLTAAAKIIHLSASAARKRLQALLITYRKSLLAAGIREP
ncbi:MAG: sigma-70 family RNA polymerase sigma factor [Desulfobacterales bacterium]|nr:MAG: sigma-70 family RNA polymerase sigma factor [Desulfobacterales bacterium]